MALEFESLSLKDFLNAFYKEYADFQAENKQEFKDKLESYKQNYEQNKNQNEPAIVANALAPLFESLGFQTKFAHKHKGNSEIDLALLKDSNVEILIEAKKPDNTAEMFKANKPNCKALHECILYYLRERENGLNRNTNIQFIIITDFYQFYLFEAGEFKRYFYDNSKIKKLYKDLESPQNSSIKTQEDFYKELKPILEEYFVENREGDLFNIALKGLYFDLRNDKHLSIAHKILNRDFLHREYKRDPNALNLRFYKELLHILGLKEFDKGGKITIEFDDTQNVSFAKHIASKLESDNKSSDFEAVMSHILIWLNRVLFLKLIEANLLHFNDFNKDLRFLSSTKITSFKHLSHLFFEVLAKDYEDSDKDKKDKRGSDKGFNFLPYLNSSLFIRDNALEILDIGALDDDLTIQIFESTQTAHTKDKTCKFLTYLFDFLNAFDFGKESNEDSAHKDLIRSSVLGAIFEKLNGYKEGSFYTPSFITSYMCKESLSKIVIDKFNTAFAWSAQSLEDLRKQIDRDFVRVESQAKRLLESIRICDPSVGSGHFLVSALNEMIAIYHKLGLLGFGYKDLQIKDDEIYLVTKEGEKFAYKRLQDSNHTIQIALFTLKKSIIENNLFGVDINPNSCNIARLRLWIELLKNAYYLNFSKDRDSKIHKLQTLPNIDINIKCGNSLISYMGIDDELLSDITEQIKKYQKLEVDYFNGFYQDKDKMIKDIEKVKQDLLNLHFEIKFKEQLEKLKKECDKYSNSYGDYDKENLEEHYKFIKNHISVLDRLFAPNLDDEMQIKAKKALQTLKNEHDKIFNLSKNFEWRIEFSKLLNTGLTKEQIIHNNKQKQKGDFKALHKDESGKFLGFDLIIGNPPYMQVPKGIFDTKLYPYSEGKDKGKQNLYKVFIELGYNLGHKNSIVSLITQSSIMCDLSAQYTRELLLKNTQMHYFVEFKDNEKIFTNVSQAVCMLEFQKAKPTKEHSFQIAINNTESQMDKIQFESITQQQILDFFPLYEIPLIKKGEMPIVAKVKTNRILLKNLLNSSLQGNINTIHLKKIQSNKRTNIFIYKGAHCHRWYLDKEPFYGLDNELTRKIIEKNQNSYIIATQNIHTATSKYRIYANFTESKNTKIVFLDSCNISYCKNARDAKFLVGLLNSKLLNWLFKITSTNNHVNLYELESLPIPKITKQNQTIVNEIIALVDEILRLKAKDSHCNISHLEAQIDNLVYKLYNLNENEIKIVEN